MKNLLFVISTFCVLNVNAQNYLITFTGTGASTTVNSVEVENLTAGTTRTLNVDDVLRLTITTAINSIENGQSSRLKIYPNPMTDKSTLLISAPNEGDAIISVYDITGRVVTQIDSYLENYTQEFTISGLRNGMHLINVKGDTYQFSGKLISNGKSNGATSIEKVSGNIAVDKMASKTENKGVQSTIDMEYTTGDRLKFKGISGIYNTVLTDIPDADKTITFNFVACNDGDNNTYPVVEIGNQIWMAENLKTTKYNDDTAIPLVTSNTSWSDLTTPGYCWYNNNEAAYKNTHGAIYNWYTANNGNLCPTGWHVPTDGEFTILVDYLIANGFNYDGTTAENKIAKSLASTSGWTSSSNTGAVGNTDYPAKRNATGFTALPGGYRYTTGAFLSIEDLGIWWSATDYGAANAWNRNLSYDPWISVLRGYYNMKAGYSIRCIKDN